MRFERMRALIARAERFLVIVLAVKSLIDALDPPKPPASPPDTKSPEGTEPSLSQP